ELRCRDRRELLAGRDPYHERRDLRVLQTDDPRDRLDHSGTFQNADHRAPMDHWRGMAYPSMAHGPTWILCFERFRNRRCARLADHDSIGYKRLSQPILAAVWQHVKRSYRRS